jgi:hypothetical protein
MGLGILSFEPGKVYEVPHLLRERCDIADSAGDKSGYDVTYV